MRQALCPICRRAVPADTKSFPFCSPRCRDVDLNRWLTESYPVPVQTERVAREALGELTGEEHSVDDE